MGDRGEFFAIDRRVWPLVCDLGVNPSCAYLVIAAGTGGDNITSAWSASAIEKYAGIRWHLAEQAINKLIEHGLIRRIQADKPRARPLYKLTKSSDIPALESVATAEDDVSSKIWLPNTLVTGAADEPSPVTILRQTRNPDAIRLLVDVYGDHRLDQVGGIWFRTIRKEYTRTKVGQQEEYDVWGFDRHKIGTPGYASFYRSFNFNLDDPDKKIAEVSRFWSLWKILLDIGLIEEVAHIVDIDADEGEILYPLPLQETSISIEYEITLAAREAALLLVQKQRASQIEHGFEVLVPVLRHLQQVQLVGIYRLRYRPRTAATAAFIARCEKWKAVLADLQKRFLGVSTSRDNQGDIKG
jgi:hypothetical protein